MEHVYIAIDLKSFYASVECVERGLNPLTSNLVVADKSRTEKTICLAVSPSLKAFGIPGRARLFEVVSKVQEVNRKRLMALGGKQFTGESIHAPQLEKDVSLAVSYVTAEPRMEKYMEYSTRIYQIYLKYIAPEDMHVYSVDEVFMDVTQYLSIYKMTARQLAQTIIQDVLHETGITATAGIGPNLYLCKIAMDVWAKHTEADEYGVRIAELDEMSYRRLLWNHKPITDFWRVGKGYEKKLAENGLYTMGDIARCSVGKPEEYHNEALLYEMFGVNAELLIDHAWGWEPCTIADIKAYKPSANSISSGQVLKEPYDFERTRLIVKEMTELLTLDLVDKHLLTDQMVLTIGYDIENLTDKNRRADYKGEVTTDRYGRSVPKHAHGTAGLSCPTSSTRMIMDAVMELFDRIMDKKLLARRITVVAANVIREELYQEPQTYEQLSLFSDYAAEEGKKKAEKEALKRERKAQEAVLAIQKKYGKNAVLKGINLQEGATTMERNRQIGGHKA
ncbi:MAG: DNA methylase [Lachnospiraceae bacterium]